MADEVQASHIIISIHAPREGGDTQIPAFTSDTSIFQSTPPARGATQCAAAGHRAD